MSKNSSGQSGVDLMLSYAWIVILGAGAIIILSQSGSFNEVKCEHNTFGFSQIVPADWAVYRDTNTVVLRIQNIAGDPVEIAGITAAIGNTSCIKSNAVPLNTGGEAIVVLDCSGGSAALEEYALGSCYIGDIEFKYVNTRTQSEGTSKGRIRGPVEEGFATDLTTPQTTLESEATSSTSSGITTSTSQVNPSSTTTIMGGSTTSTTLGGGSTTSTSTTSSTTTSLHSLIDLVVIPGWRATIPSKSVYFDVTVTNYGNNDTVDLFVSGDLIAWTRFQDKKKLVKNMTYKMKSNESKSTQMVVGPTAATPLGSHMLRVSASSRTDEDAWDQEDVTVFMGSLKGLTGFHVQPEPPSGLGLTGSRAREFGLSVYYDDHFTTGSGLNLKTGDPVCSGENITIGLDPSGEFFGKGGPYDSPPVTFVDNLESALASPGFKGILRYYDLTVCSWKAIQEKETGPDMCSLSAAVICESPCRITSTGSVTQFSSDRFNVYSEGIQFFNVTCVARCLMCAPPASKNARPVCKPFKISGPGDPWYAGNSSQAVTSESVYFNATRIMAGPDIRIVNQTFSYIQIRNVLTMVLTVENTGELRMYLDKVKLNTTKSYMVTKPGYIEPGAKAAVKVVFKDYPASYLNATAITFSYHADSKACTKTKDYSKTFVLGRCSSDSECSDLSDCTTDTCLNPGTVNSMCGNAPVCPGTDDNCGCSSCRNCNSLDYYDDSCKWQCASDSARKCFRTKDDYSCMSNSCEKRVLDYSYLENCPAGKKCNGGVCI
jgi:hypothetical protein